LVAPIIVCDGSSYSSASIVRNNLLIFITLT
jgi:hypothetical protein